MPLFYRGAGPGTYWHTNDARLTGFTAQFPGMARGINQLRLHIARGTVASPYISLTRSYAVAWDYAVSTGKTTVVATAANPGFVYEIEIDKPAPRGLVLIDPTKEVADALPKPLDSVPPYQHDGGPEFLLGVVDPVGMPAHLTAPYLQPPPGGGTARPPNLSIDLETLVRALRDAEILALGSIPAHCILRRIAVS